MDNTILPLELIVDIATCHYKAYFALLYTCKVIRKELSRESTKDLFMWCERVDTMTLKSYTRRLHGRGKLITSYTNKNNKEIIIIHLKNIITIKWMPMIGRYEYRINNGMMMFMNHDQCESLVESCG
jgi:hypothetical protein